ncbi:MAG: hypothetical protein JXR68_11820 [Bacteroidales bacterium]|nr:hypothetical protein [Bacteroidales bacterium]
MKKLVLILVILIPLGFATMAQADYSDAQMFGSKRPPSSDMIHVFGTITSDVVSHEFTIKNTNQVDVTISAVDIPDGFGVVLIDKVIPANSEVKFIVYVYKNYLNSKDDFSKNIILTTEYSAFGNIIQNKETYLVEGSF